MKNFEQADDKQRHADRLRLLLSKVREARDSGDAKEEVGSWLEITKDVLAERFEITDLTNIEGLRLRKIIEKVVEEDKDMEDRKNIAWKEKREQDAKAISWNTPEIDNEAISRWLLELYSIDLQQIPQIKIDDNFKEYLRRLRERSHNP